MTNAERTSNNLHTRLLKVFVFLIIVTTLIITHDQLNLVSAIAFYFFHPGIGTPVIDGNVEASEWAAADTFTQSMYGSDTGLTGTLYVLQDKENLYLGFVIDDDELTVGDWYGILGDTLEIDFDDNNSGALFEVGENKLTINSVTTFRDSHYVNTTGSSSADTQQDGQGILARQGSNNHVELSFPLCSGDTEDFCLSGGDVLGLRLRYSDYDTLTAVPSPIPDSSSLPGSDTTSLVTIEILTIYDAFLPLVFK